MEAQDCSYDISIDNGKTCWSLGLLHLVSGTHYGQNIVFKLRAARKAVEVKNSRGMCPKGAGGVPCRSNHKGTALPQWFLHFT